MAKRELVIGIVSVAAVLVGGVLFARGFGRVKSPAVPAVVAPVAVSAEPAILKHLSMPKTVKGIYLTARTVGSERYGELLDLVDRTELNAVVIDVKSDDGALAFEPVDPTLKTVTSSVFLPKLEGLTEDLRERGIYSIARIFVFEDPWYAEHSTSGLRIANGALWGDKKGVRWVDPASEEVWRYNKTIAEEVWRRGFDEVQFDYIRFPTDGNTKAIVYPVWDGQESKRSVMSRFFRYMGAGLVDKGIPVSVDLFGYAVRDDEEDVNIGQNMKDVLPHLTALSPMVYPSHYYAGSYGIAQPALHPAEIVAESMTIANRVIASSTDVRATVRPWLQDFDIGADYDAAKVRAEIDAAEQGGASGWLLWNARNVYTEGALEASMQGSGE